MTETLSAGAPAATIFDRIVVGVDGHAESIAAVHEAAAMLAPAGELVLLGAYDLPATIGAAGLATVPSDLADIEPFRRAAQHAVTSARRELPDGIAAEDVAVRGRPWEALLVETERRGATLVAVGTRGHGRARGLVVGSTTTEVVHRCPTSVLVARGFGGHPPRTIVVGVDGSPASRLAYEAARHLALRFGSRLRAVVAYQGKDVDVIGADLMVGHALQHVNDHPVSALLAAAEAADLVVVGSRGLHGVKALGSVSERIAHRAKTSVLVVR